jgi:hypothetical protein
MTVLPVVVLSPVEGDHVMVEAEVVAVRVTLWPAHCVVEVGATVTDAPATNVDVVAVI